MSEWGQRGSHDDQVTTRYRPGHGSLTTKRARWEGHPQEASLTANTCEAFLREGFITLVGGFKLNLCMGLL